MFVTVYQVLYDLAPVFVSSFTSHQIILKMTLGLTKLLAMMQPLPNALLLCAHTRHLSGLSSSLTHPQKNFSVSLLLQIKRLSLLHYTLTSHADF